MIIARTFTFDSAHILTRHPGKCSRLHGHTYKLEVAVEGNVTPETGMVVDFGDVAEVVGSKVLRTWDHRFLVAQYSPDVTFWTSKHYAVDRQIYYDAGYVILEVRGEEIRVPATMYEVIPIEHTTAEMLSRHLFGILAPFFMGASSRLIHVGLWETPTSFAIAREV